MTRGVLATKTTKTTKAMKSSGVAWLGDIPDGWEICRLKNVVAIYNGNSIPDSEKIKYEDPINAYPYISSKDIDATFSTANYENGMFTKKEDVLFKIAKAGSVLMCIEGGSAGRKKVLLKKDVSFVNKLACFAPMSIDGRYLFYFLLSPNFEEHFSQNLTGLIGGVSVSSLRNMPILVPNGSEQEAISVYLDEKCGAIDAAIVEAKKGIEEYKAWKKSLIFEAVTGKQRVGVFNAETQSRREAEKMKPSGIPWIGTIPEGWKVSRVKNECDCLDYLREPISAENRVNEKALYDYYGASGAIDKIDDFNVDDTVLLIGEDGANLRMRNLPLVYRASGKIWVNNHAHILKVKPSNAYGFMAYALEAGDYNDFVTGSAQPKLTQTDLMAMPVVLPSLPEQQAIADYLDEKCAAIDALVAEKEKLIADLEAYKKSLIFELVTGKREVA